MLFRERFLVPPSYSIIQLQTQYARLSSIPHAPFRLPTNAVSMWDGARMVLMVRSRGRRPSFCLNVGSSGIRRKGRSRGGIKKEGRVMRWDGEKSSNSPKGERQRGAGSVPAKRWCTLCVYTGCYDNTLILEAFHKCIQPMTTSQ